LADTVYNVLLDQFMDGSRAAGESLNIAELSVELKVSQTPIREALARLENTGLVDREALRGYRVAPGLSEAEIDRLTDARLVIEPVLAALAATRATPEFLGGLLDSIAELERPERNLRVTRCHPVVDLGGSDDHESLRPQVMPVDRAGIEPATLFRRTRGGSLGVRQV